MEQKPKLKCKQCYREITVVEFQEEILKIIKETRKRWGIRSYEEEKQEWEEKRKQEEDFVRWKKEKLQRTYINEIEEEDKKRKQGKNEREWKKQREELRRWEEK